MASQSFTQFHQCKTCQWILNINKRKHDLEIKPLDVQEGFVSGIELGLPDFQSGRNKRVYFEISSRILITFPVLISFSRLLLFYPQSTLEINNLQSLARSKTFM
jgi:hypothetical protein